MKPLYVFDHFLQQLNREEFTQYRSQIRLLDNILFNPVLSIYTQGLESRIKADIRPDFAPVFQQLLHTPDLVSQIEAAVTNGTSIALPPPSYQLDTTLPAPFENWTGLDASTSTTTAQVITYPQGSIANFQNRAKRKGPNQDAAVIATLSGEQTYGQPNTQFARQADYAQILTNTYHELDQRFDASMYSGGTTAATNLLVNHQIITATLADAAPFLIAYGHDGSVTAVKRLNQVTHKPVWSE